MTFSSTRKWILRTVFFAALGATGWFFISIRSNYYAQVSVTESVRFAEQIIAAVSAYQHEHQRLPPSLSAISLPHGEYGYIPEVTFHPDSGFVSVEVISKEGKFGSFRYIPEQGADGHIKWRCENVSVSSELLTPQCAIPALSK